MSDKNILAITVAATLINFVQDVRVIKAPKKDRDAAKAKGIAEDSPEYPKDRQLPLVRPDFSVRDNVIAFAGAFYDAAEAHKPGSADELLAKAFRSRCSDATMESVDAEGNLDDAKYVKFITQDVSGTQTLSQLKAQESALAVELITLSDIYQAGETAVADAGYGDVNALLIVIQNKKRQWNDVRTVVAARESEAEKKKAKADAKKKKAAPAPAQA
jgi:hypothetical protein